MSIVVPQQMDSTAISGLADLQSHLQDLERDGSIPFNAKLFDDVELQLTESNIPAVLPLLLGPLTTILKSTRQDPTPLLTLTIKLLSPLSFTRTLTIADPPSLVTALQSPLPGANLLAISILRKAAHSPSDAAILSTLPDVFEGFVKRWLEADDVGVGETSARVLAELLDTDCEIHEGNEVNGIHSVEGNEIARRPRIPGQGRLWHLFIEDRTILDLIPSACSTDSNRTEHQRTISQGRLLRLLPRLAPLDLRALTRTPHPDLLPLPQNVVSEVGQGLLQWAAFGMVDKSDVLMHFTLIDFFEAFVSVMCTKGRTAHNDTVVSKLVKSAVSEDNQLENALRSLPNRTVEEEEEPLRRYISQILS